MSTDFNLNFGALFDEASLEALVNQANNKVSNKKIKIPVSLDDKNTIQNLDKIGDEIESVAKKAGKIDDISVKNILNQLKIVRSEITDMVNDVNRMKFTPKSLELSKLLEDASVKYDNVIGKLESFRLAYEQGDKPQRDKIFLLDEEINKTRELIQLLQFNEGSIQKPFQETVESAKEAEQAIDDLQKKLKEANRLSQGYVASYQFGSDRGVYDFNVRDSAKDLVSTLENDYGDVIHGIKHLNEMFATDMDLQSNAKTLDIEPYQKYIDSLRDFMKDYQYALDDISNFPRSFEEHKSFYVEMEIDLEDEAEFIERKKELYLIMKNSLLSLVEEYKMKSSKLLHRNPHKIRLLTKNQKKLNLILMLLMLILMLLMLILRQLNETFKHNKIVSISPLLLPLKKKVVSSRLIF